MKTNGNGDVEVDSIEAGEQIIIRGEVACFVLLKVPSGFLVTNDLRNVSGVEFVPSEDVIECVAGRSSLRVTPGAFLGE